MVMALRMHLPVSAYYDWQGGLVWLEIADEESNGDLLRTQIGRHGGGHATLVRPGTQTPAGEEAFEPQTVPLAELARRIKAQFDPKGILNPGRMGI
jgi:glycolate oxidase FAD binding subunit